MKELTRNEKENKTYPGSSKQDILSLGNIFPFKVCLFLAFSSPPWEKSQDMVRVSYNVNKNDYNITLYRTVYESHKQDNLIIPKKDHRIFVDIDKSL